MWVIYKLPNFRNNLKSQGGVLQAANYWANTGVLTMPSMVIKLTTFEFRDQHLGTLSSRTQLLP